MKKVQGRASTLRIWSSVGLAVLMVAALSLMKPQALAGQRAARSLAKDQASFLSGTAQLQNNSGSPVGPTRKIIICHKGNTIRVSEAAVPAHLAHGDSLGPCGEDEVVCRRGHTVVVSRDKVLPSDILGACSNQVFMCNLHLRTIVVAPNAIDAHLARGHRLGLCPGKSLVCHNGRTIVVLDSEVPTHMAHGDALGYCLGAPGPLITNLPPSFASQ
jgi:hypothetical protein